MDELLLNNEMKTFIDSMNSIKEITNEELTDEMMESVQQLLDNSFSHETNTRAINEIIQNLESQGQTRAEALKGANALKEFINETLYGDEEIVGNKKKLIDGVVEKMNNIFDAALEKYHNYAIELPMTLEGYAQVPTYAHETDAAADLYAAEGITIPAHSRGNKIKTGVKIQLPEGWLAMILPRSSMGTKTPLRLSNSVGLIDSGYRGELGVVYDNISDEDYCINGGDRIAQLLVMPSYRFKANVVETLEDSDRGETGFGDSGK